MKHLLFEKFILDERLTLLEALAVADVESLKDKLTQLAKNLATKESDTKNNETIDAIKEEIFVLQNTIEDTKDPAMVKGNANKMVSKIEQLIKTADSTFNVSSFATVFGEIKTLAASNNYSKQTVTILKTKLELLANAIETIQDNMESADNSNTDASEKVADAASSLNRLLAYAKSNPIDAFESRFLLCKNAYDTYKTDPSKLNDLLSACDGLDDFITKELEKAGFNAGGTAADDADWGVRFKKATDKKLFWEEYYKKVWGADAQRVIALGEAFRKQCESLGFSSKTNPFITFVQNYIIEKNYSISKEVYDVIHNKVVDGTLKSADLTSKTKYISNLIYCKDLYSKSAADVKQYFDLLKDITKLDPTEVLNDPTGDGTTEYKNIFSWFDTTNFSKDQFVWIILYNGHLDIISKNSGGAHLAMPSDITKVEGSKLRSSGEIEKILDTLDSDREVSKAFDNSSITSLITTIISSSIEAEKWVRMLCILFLVLADANEIYNNYSKVKNTSFTIDEELEMREKIGYLGDSMTKTQINKVITTLKDDHGIDLT